MYTVNEDVLSAYNSYARTVTGKAIINNVINVTGDDLISLECKSTIDTGQGISIGGAFSSELSMHIRGVDIPNDNLKIQAFVDVNGTGFVPLGTFYSTDIDSDDNYATIKITAYDSIAFLTDMVRPSSFNTKNIVNSLGVEYSIPISSHLTALLGNGINVPDTGIDYDSRTLLGYVAGMYGKNAIINNDGYLDFVGFTNANVEIDADNQYQGGFTHKSKDDYIVHSLVAKVGEEEIAVGRGRAMMFENPWMTADRLQIIFADIDGLQLTPSTCHYRGNPALNVGDIVTVEDFEGSMLPVIITTHSIKVAGGMDGNITSSALSDNAVSTTSSGSIEEVRVIAAAAKKDSAHAVVMANGKNTIHYGTSYSGITGMINGDMFVDTAHNNKVYIYNGSSWSEKKWGYEAIDVESLFANQIEANYLTVTGNSQIIGGTIGGFDVDDTGIRAGDIDGQYMLLDKDGMLRFFNNATGETSTHLWNTLEFSKTASGKRFSGSLTDHAISFFRFGDYETTGNTNVVTYEYDMLRHFDAIGNPRKTYKFTVDGKQVAYVDDAIGGRNYLLESYARATGTSNGITRTYLGDCTYRINGTATAEYDGAVYTLSTINFEPGRYTVSFIGDVSNLKDVYVSVGTPSATETAVFNSTDKQKVTFDIPEGKVIRYVGVHVDSGVTIDTEIQLKMEKGSIQTDWTPALADMGPKFEVTTESITGINISGGTTTSATTFNMSKEGYYPLGIVGEYWSTGNNTMYANTFYKHLSTQEEGSGVITYRIRNMASSSAITGTLVFKVLWIRIK